MSYPGDENPMFRKREPPTWQPRGEQAPGQPYGDQQPVWQDQQRPQFQHAPSTNGLAIASLVLSISAFVALPLIGSISGVVCGHIARSQLRQSREPEQGDGLALAGLIIGWIGIAFYVLLLLFIFGVIFAAA